MGGSFSRDIIAISWCFYGLVALIAIIAVAAIAWRLA